MVEGPGCKLKGEKMKGKVVGQKVVHVAGNAIENRPKRDLEKPTPFHQLIGTRITDVKTLGKELFIFFSSETCLRVHFLMAGFVRYNEQSEDPDESARKKVPERPRLELQLDKDVVALYQCSAEVRDGKQTFERWEAMINLDICWPEFNSQRAVQEIMNARNADRLICDVILDQEVLPGVGNIIKNEALFDAGINPLSKVSELTSTHVTRLVKMNRDFSLIFYDCRKTGKPLHKFYKMYRFSSCKQCQTKVVKCKPGEYERGTYFCPKCQTNALDRAGPSKNSLLGWTSGGATSQVNWSCLSCTFENKPGSLKCFACGTAREKRKAPSQLLPTLPDNPTSATKMVANAPPAKKIKMSDSAPPVQKALRAVENKARQSASVKVELCKGHMKPCVSKTVNKAGDNKGRQFYACSFPRGKACDHFSWADLHHPRCEHKSITLLREVYKQNQNNGRAFFVCPKPKKDQCGFFQWKDE